MRQIKKSIWWLFHGVTKVLASLSTKRVQLLPSFQLVRNEPKNLSAAELPYFSKELKKDFQGVTKVVAKNVLLVVNEGLVIKKMYILPESLMKEETRSWYNLNYYKSAYTRPRLLPPANYLYVYNHYGVGYGHWLADILPRLLMVKDEVKKYKILLPENYNTFHLQTLAPFGIAKDQIEHLKLNQSYRIPQLTLISHVGTTCNTKDDTLRELRSIYLNFYLGKEWPAPTRKLYISRSKMTHRKVTNEIELEKLLLAKGFEILYPEEYTFEQQVALFAQCKVLAGLTGSGFTNMLFMQEGASVLEFKMKGDYNNLHYFSMASGMQLDYYYLLCQTEGQERLTADFIVDLPQLEEIIETIAVKSIFDTHG